MEAIIPANTLGLDGQYRICSMTGSFTHQPQLSPTLQRGPMEDCIRVKVVNSDSEKAANLRALKAL